jgi:hypothetical protein
VLVEFSLVALILYVLLASMVEFGRAYVMVQGAEQAARVAARELALLPLPASLSFEEALATPIVLERVYDPSFLVIDVQAQVPDVDGIPGIGGPDIDAFFGLLPVVNRALRPLMTRETVALGGAFGERDLIRYPGALLLDPAAPPGASGLTIGIPQVVGRDADGVETIIWRRVVEEVRENLPGPVPATESPFSVLSADGGLVALRIHVPFQAATLGSYRTQGAGPFEPNLQHPNLALDSAVRVAEESPALWGEVINSLDSAGAYGGPYGLGTLTALNTQLRPFRRLFVAQSIQRRELPLGL